MSLLYQSEAATFPPIIKPRNATIPPMPVIPSQPPIAKQTTIIIKPIT